MALIEGAENLHCVFGPHAEMPSLHRTSQEWRSQEAPTVRSRAGSRAM